MPRFVPRERKHKRIARGKKESGKADLNVDTNATEIIPAAQLDKTARYRALRQQIQNEQPETRQSSKKRKRLDKYIDTKLRKEENAELLQKLANQKIDTSLLRSSKKLGRSQENRREKLHRALAERHVLGLDNDEILFEPRHKTREVGSDHEDGSEEDGVENLSHLPHSNGVPVTVHCSGLKRPLDVDESGRPVITKRKRRKRDHLSFAVGDDGTEQTIDQVNGTFSDGEGAEEEWYGFSEPEANSDRGDESLDVDGSSREGEEGDTDGETTASSEDETDVGDKPARISAFKMWADSQRNAAIDFTPSLPTRSHDVDEKMKANFRPRATSPDPVAESLLSSTIQPSTRPSTAITISRSEVVQQARLELPVVQEEQKIIETINNNPVTIICGATGSGKTTQVPQMLFENGYGSHVGTSSATDYLESKGRIGVTQPRRVAATSVADRVAYELGPGYRDRVAHQVRYDTNVSRSTAIKFMTDGILLREIQTDFPLSKYSCIIIDEAHERSVNMDILIGMLSRIVRLRADLAVEEPEKFCPLKLVIMSATLRVNDFLQNDRLFGSMKPPVVEIEGRQYSVSEHFARRTKRDYVEEMVEKVTKGHRKLPPGGMLVFLTGQQEINTVSKRLREKLSGCTSMWKGSAMTGARDIDDYEDDGPRSAADQQFIEGEARDEDVDSEAEVLLEAEGEDEFAVEDDRPNPSAPKGVLKPYILSLYAALPAAQQLKVFQPPAEGHRLIVLATNVAETSLTIPGIRYVFDSGRSKEKRYDRKTGVQTFEVDWISKASAAQRTGRAGRTGPGGHVWRLYSSAVYEQYFEEHTVPEILRTPLESVVLQLKGLEIENVGNFPFPTAPEAEQLKDAERLLRNLGAISSESITATGKELMGYPVSPRLSKMLVLARKNNVMQHVIALVAGLAVGDLYIPEAHAARDELEEDGDETSDADKQHQAYTRAQATLARWDDHSDAVKLLTAIAAHAEAQTKGSEANSSFCKNFWLREKGMTEVQQLRRQLHSICSTQNNDGELEFKTMLPLTTDKERSMLSQIVAAGYIDQVAIRADLLKDDSASFGRKPRRAIEVAYRTLLPTISDADVDRTADPVEQAIQRSVFIHPSSVLAKLSPKEMPQYIVYSHLSRAPTATVEGKIKKTRMHPLTAVGPKVLAVLAEGSPLLDVGKPIGKIEELPDWRRQCWIGVSLRSPESRGAGWSLGAWKVVQRRGKKGDWTIEKVVAR